MNVHIKKSLLGLMLLLLAACGGSSNVPDANSTVTAATRSSEQQCVENSPLLRFGDGAQNASLEPIPQAAAEGITPRNVDAACLGNDQFRYAAGIADITGPAGGKIQMGNEDPTHYSQGLYMRQYARSFVISSPCNGKRVALTLTDTGMLFESIRGAVLDQVKADPTLAAFYGPDNVMLSATHTHSGPGGYSHYTAYNALRFGYDDRTFKVIVAGIMSSLRQAHRNFERHPSTGPITMAMGELLGANASRASYSYAQNVDKERERYRDVQGKDVNTNRLMTLLRLQRRDGTEVGAINWFSVHPTSADEATELIHGDNKGYAAFRFEHLKGTDLESQREPFVSAFMQSDQGDVFSRIWHKNDEAGRAKQLPAQEPYPLVTVVGTMQLAKALKLYDQAKDRLTGPLDYRLMYVKMDAVEVTDPTVLASLQHPPELDMPVKRTCSAAMGFSFASGGFATEPDDTTGGKFTPAALSCRNPGMVDAAQKDIMRGLAGKIPSYLGAYAVGCNLSKIPGLNLQCQAEKPVLFVFGPPLNLSPNIVPFQLIRLGNLAIIGLPWEVSTMSGRRIRQTVLSVLRETGIDYVVITGLANDYVSYLTTREEYAVQEYESASNQFGPWSLAATQQELRKLAISLRDGAATGVSLTPPGTTPTLYQVLPPGPTDFAPPGSAFGAVVKDAKSRYALGEAARVTFQTANPSNDLKTGSSFLWVERKNAQGAWDVVSRDRDPETHFRWISDSPSAQVFPTFTSLAEIEWRIPGNALPGIYRIRHNGVASSSMGVSKSEFEGISSEFEVVGQPGVCP